MRGRCLTAALASLFLVCGQVKGAGFQLREDSVVGMGSAYAGSASGENGPATVFDNPAAMTQLPKLQIQLGGSLVVPSFVFHGSSKNAFGRPNTGVSDRDGGNPAFLPHAYLTYPLTPDLSFGIALTSPFGLSTTYGPDFVGRYQADKTSLVTYNINPAVAYKVADWLSLGAGVSAQYARANFSNFLNASTIATAALGQPRILPDGYFRLRGDSWAFGYNLGILVTPGPRTNIGFAYRSRVQQDFAGTADFIVPPILAANPNFRNSSAKAKLVLPDSATVSITQGLGSNWTISADVTWVNWSQFKTLSAFRTDGTQLSSTPEHYDNSFFVAFGGSYKASDRLTLRSGVAYDKSPVSSSYRTARVPDADRVWLSGGASFKVLENLLLDAAYTHIFVKDGRIQERSSTNDVLTGYFENSADVISLGTRLQF